ncbi:MAG: hypothetical protein R3C44_20590 [Chloroflexota bacterium]
MLANLLFAACRQWTRWGRISLQLAVAGGDCACHMRERPAEDYNLTLNNLPAMIASQTHPPAQGQTTENS